VQPGIVAGGRIQQSDKFLVRFRIKRKHALIQQHVFGLPAGAFQHKVRARLSEQRGGLINQVTLPALRADIDIDVACLTAAFVCLE